MTLEFFQSDLRDFEKSHLVGNLYFLFNYFLVTFDIETYETSVEKTRQNTTVHASLKLLSIGIGTNFGPERFIMRGGDTCDDALHMVEKFVFYLESISLMNEMKLPPEFDIALERLDNLIENGSFITVVIINSF